MTEFSLTKYTGQWTYFVRIGKSAPCVKSISRPETSFPAPVKIKLSLSYRRGGILEQLVP